jgi:hypothetical protein
MDPQRVTAVLGEIMPERQPTNNPRLFVITSAASDDQLWADIFKVNKLAYQIAHGDLSDVRGGDRSRAVIMLLNALARATGCDASRMARMIRHRERVNTSSSVFVTPRAWRA